MDHAADRIYKPGHKPEHKPRRARRTIAFVTGLLALAAGCRSTAPWLDASAALPGSSWLAEEIDGQRVLEKPPATLEFEGGNVVGWAACNRYVAPVEMERNQLRVGKAAVSRETCNPAVLGQELRFLTALGATAGFRQDGDTLRLTDEQGVTRILLARMLVSPRSFQCSDGVRFVGLLLRPLDTDNVEAVLPDRRRRLTRMAEDPGEQFADGDVSVRITGAEGIMKIDGQLMTCTEKSAG